MPHHTPWILLAASTNVVVTTIHHLHGARIYDTPERYTSVWIAAAALLLAGVLALLGDRPERTARFYRRAFDATILLVFVVVFGVAEGFGTHVVHPVLQGGYGTEEPFDALLQVTGRLHVIPADAAAALLLHGTRSVGRPTPNEPARDPA